MDHWAILIVVVAALIQGFFGFGYSIFSVSLLTWLWADPKQAVVFACCTVFFHTGTMLPWSMKRAPWEDVPWIVFGVLVGCALGIFIFHKINAAGLLFLLGVCLIVTMLWKFSKRSDEKTGADKLSRGLTAGAGLIVGAIGALVSANGPALLLYGNYRGWAPMKIKAFVQPVFMSGVIFSLVGYTVIGKISTELVMLAFCAALPIILLTLLGMHFADRLPHRTFERVFYTFAGLMGVFLIVQSLSGK